MARVEDEGMDLRRSLSSSLNRRHFFAFDSLPLSSADFFMPVAGFDDWELERVVSLNVFSREPGVHRQYHAG